MQYGLPHHWPPQLSEITNFIADLSLKGLSYATARSYVSAISFNCKIQNFPDVPNNFIIAKLLQGMKRLKHRPDTRLPITPQILIQLITSLPHICTNAYEAKLFSAAFSLAFFGFLRIGEIAMSSRKANHYVIGITDILVDNSKSNVYLTLRYSKTDQSGKGVTIIIPKANGIHCPLTNAQAFLGVRPPFPGPLFCHFGGDPLTRYQFSAILRKSLAHLNLEFTAYKCHSFRIGAATSAAMSGYPSDDIKTAGRWKSIIYSQFICTNLF